MIKVKDIANGAILWNGNKILGIKNATLDKKYDNYYCKKVPGNNFDYELVNIKENIEK